MSSAAQTLRPWLEHLRRSWRSSPLPAFLRWWGGELRSLLPPRWRGWFGDAADWHLLQLDGSLWTLRRAGEGQPLASWDDELDARLQQATLAAALRHVDREDLRLALLLPPEVVLRRTLLLPEAAQHNLQQVLAFEMDRQTPFNLAQVHYAARELDKAAPGGRFHAELVAVMRSTLDPLLARLRALGIVVDAVDQMAGTGRLGVNLLPAEQAPHRRRPRRRLNLALAGCCVLLLALLLGQWLHNRQLALSRMQDTVQAMRGEAQQVASLRQQLQDDAGAAGFLAQRKKQSVSMLALLQEITQRLPDSAWLERFSVDNSGQVGMQGQSLQAVKLLDMLKDARLITDASFQGSIQPDPATGKERFYLTAQLRKPPGAAKPPSDGGGAP